VKKQLSEDISPPPIHIEINDEAIDAMKCVNMLGDKIYCIFLCFSSLFRILFTLATSTIISILIASYPLGILWAGRGQVKKSLLYLLSVKKMYHSASDALKTQLKLKLKQSFASDLDSIYTHNLFYLAQAYGENIVRVGVKT
jgi:hypothetical protein